MSTSSSAPATSTLDPLDASGAPSTRTLGLVPSPGQCERMVERMISSLPGLLADHVDDTLDWDIKVVPDPLTGSNIETPRLLDELGEWQDNHRWDIAIAVTDLPVHDDDIVVAEASVARQLAWISTPPLGVIHLHDRTRALVIELVDELRWRDSTASEDAAGPQSRTDGPKISPRFARKIESPRENEQADLRYVAPRLMGHARLLAGMVYANRPWSLFPSFKTTIATAFATGGYGLIFSTLWELGNLYELWRLILLMLVAMAILIGWIIIAHGLWKAHRDSSSRYLTTLYNAATVLTITAGVVFAYALVFLMLLSAALVYIPDTMLESTIQQPVTPMSFLRIAWITASVATIAGAVGAGLEDTDAVRNATFSWRQHHRFQEHERAWGAESNSPA